MRLVPLTNAAKFTVCSPGRDSSLRPPKLGEHNSTTGGIPPIHTDCVDGGMEQFSFLQPVIAGKKTTPMASFRVFIYTSGARYQHGGPEVEIVEVVIS